VHTFARDRAGDEEPEHRSRAALHRLLTWYMHTADNASHALFPHRRVPTLRPVDGPTPPLTFTESAEALRWCVAERNNVIAGIHTSFTNEWYELTWRTTDLLYPFFALRKHWDNWVDTHREALLATRRLADRTAEARILNGLGIAYAECRRSTEALQCFENSLRISRERGDRHCESQVLNNIGETYRRIDQLPAAIEYYRQDLANCRETGDRHGEAVSINNIGKALFAMGHHREALRHHDQALTICVEISNQHSTGEILNDLGDTYRALTELTLAVDYYHQALNIRRGIGDLHGEAETLHNLGNVYEIQGDTRTALNHYGQALTIWRTIGDQWAIDVTLHHVESLSNGTTTNSKARISDPHPTNNTT
jgi:tetratricopeptide (TPR) repeat protein